MPLIPSLPTFIIIVVLPAIITRGTGRAMSTSDERCPRLVIGHQAVFVLRKMERIDDRPNPSSGTTTETCQMHYLELLLPCIAKLRKCEGVEEGCGVSGLQTV